MIELNPSRWNVKPFRHQVDGVRKLVTDQAFALYDEMGVGKSKQVVDAACALADAGKLRTVIVIAPANVRSVWLARDDDPAVDGEIHKHAWPSIAHRALEFHSRRAGTCFHERWKLRWDAEGRASRDARLTWIVTNYEFVRGDMLDDLAHAAEDGPTMLVLDESSFVINHASKQWKAVKKLRAACDRCVLLNGTPTTNNPLDLWGQFAIMDERIFGRRFKNFYHFRWRYAEMVPARDRGHDHQKIVGFKNLGELNRIVAPHALRRLKTDCLDLPPKIYTTREVALTASTWAKYVELRRDAIVTLADDDVQVEPNAGVKLLRLSQLTSGHLGRTTLPEGLPLKSDFDVLEMPLEATTVDVSSEKIDWCRKYLSDEQTANAVIVWCRWRRERERLVGTMRSSKPERGGFAIFELYGGQAKAEREAAIAAFQGHGDGRRLLVAQPHAGGFGLNLTAAATVVYLSNDYSLRVRLQSEDRCHRPGQERSVTYVDVLATGPRGQRTVDHTVVKALRTKRDLAEMTGRAWRRELEKHVEER